MSEETMSERMTGKPTAAPGPDEVRIRLVGYPILVELFATLATGKPERVTLAEVSIEGPDGERATAGLVIEWTGKAWRAGVEHDATDRRLDRVHYVEVRRASVPLRFFTRAAAAGDDPA